MVADVIDGAMFADNAPAHYLPLRKVIAVGIGNGLEFYDFLTFSFFAIQIGHSFFPASETSNGLLLSLATFGVGFITRPLGGIIIGTYGDRVGRKPAMMLSFALMGVAIIGVSLTPSYAQIGVAAPILLLVFRLVQGFALGGEVGPSTAFLIEAAPPHRRGIYVALQFATQDVAVVVAGVVGFSLSNLLDPSSLDAWGWRLAFLIGAAIVPFGLIVRRTLPETLHASGDATPMGAERRVPARIVVLGLMMMMAMTISAYVLDYMTTFAQDTLHLSVAIAFGATIVTGTGSVAGDVIGGLLSDRLGRKPVMLSGIVCLLLLVLPAYIVMTRLPSAGMLFSVTAILSLLVNITAGPSLISITESLPKAVRSGALATIYAVAISMFGGTAQFTIKWLIDATGSPLAPGWYVTGALVIGAVAMALMRETAPCAQPRIMPRMP